MFETLKNAWKIADLRKKLLYTRCSSCSFSASAAAIPVPFLDAGHSARLMISGEQATCWATSTCSPVAPSATATLFALSYLPLHHRVHRDPAADRCDPAAGAAGQGRRRGTQTAQQVSPGTATVGSGPAAVGGILFPDAATTVPSPIPRASQGTSPLLSSSSPSWPARCLIMWLGEQIDNKGIGNGISMILFAGIVSRGPLRP